jgi:plastocyanin
MTASALHFATNLLAAAHDEPSKTPFYIAGSLFAVWAVVLSAIGLRNSEFPPSGTVARVVMAISFVGILATTSLAVATSTKKKEEGGERAGEQAASQGSTGGAGGGPVALATDPTGQLRYDKKALSAKAGKVSIALTNSSTTPHNVVVEKDGKKVGGSEAIVKSKSTLTLSLTPGDYTFFCSVDSHRQAGMEGKLTVS